MSRTETVYRSIGEMMEVAAAAAVAASAEKYGFPLDYSPGSVQALDPILAQVAAGEMDAERETKMWGAYLGEVVRREFGGEWDLTQYPNSASAVPTILSRGARVYPLMKVYRRLTLGEGERIDAFYEMVKQKLNDLPDV
jgi:hypothetical protein